MNKPGAALTAVILISTGMAHMRAAMPADTLLNEVTVTAAAPRKLMQKSSDGTLLINARYLSDRVTFMGSADPVAILRTLPAVSTANELQAAVNVRGSGSGSSYFAADGMRIINPMHLLGLYSTYNPGYFSQYAFRAARIPASLPNFTGGYFGASTSMEPDTVVSGQICAGLIESHAAVRVPLGERASISAAVRQTYLNQVFPNLLRFDNSSLRYEFTDANFGIIWKATDFDMLRLSAMAGQDNLKAVAEHSGAKDGSFGWKNFGGALTWHHRNIITEASISHFSNMFKLTEGGRDIDLPSLETQASFSTTVPWRSFTFGADVNYRYCPGQYNRSIEVAPCHENFKRAVEWNVDGAYRLTTANGFNFNAELRLALYHCGGYNKVIPLPRIDISYSFAGGCQVFASYSRLVNFDILIEETTAGLPADFHVNASSEVPYESTHSFDIGLSGRIPGIGATFAIDGYYRILQGITEYRGSVLSYVNRGYNPFNDIISGHGYSMGLSVCAMRQWGKMRGSVSYNLGRTRALYNAIGPDWSPTAHDRPHDLCASLSWLPIRGLSLSANYTYATGIPYTQALYGYMIGENLICLYGPHNGARLPDYKRLDISANYTLSGRGRTKHRFNISLYNALANRNVLFYHLSYSTDQGLRRKESVMKSIIPSLSYTFEF